MTQTNFEQEVLQRLTAIETDVRDVKRSVEGNHRPGLIERVTTLEERTAPLNRKETMGISAVVTGAVLLALEFLRAKLGIPL